MAEGSDIAKRRVVYELEDASEITVRRDITYRTTDAATLTFDFYRPTSTTGLLGLVLFVTGYSDVGMRAFVGCNAKDMESYMCWARLVAGTGLGAVTYATTDPATNVFALLQHLNNEHKNARN